MTRLDGDCGMLVRREWYIAIECGIDFFDLKIAQP
jgi:hypothetical protein